MAPLPPPPGSATEDIFEDDNRKMESFIFGFGIPYLFATRKLTIEVISIDLLPSSFSYGKCIHFYIFKRFHVQCTAAILEKGQKVR